MSLYYASKAYVLSFSEALAAELAHSGVTVTVLCPGPVPSEFQSRAGLRPESYPPILTRSAEQVATEGYRGLMRGQRLVVPGKINRLMTVLIQLGHRGLVLNAVNRVNSFRYRRRSAQIS